MSDAGDERPTGARIPTGENQVKSSRWTVNRKSLPLKMFYFFFFGAAGTINPYVPIYLKHINLTASEIGIITGGAVITGMFSRPALGLVADKLNVRKTLLIIGCMVFCSTFCFMWFIPTRTVAIASATNGDFLWMCPENLTTGNKSCQINIDELSECHNMTPSGIVPTQICYHDSQSFHKPTNNNSTYSVETPGIPLFCYYVVKNDTENLATISRGAFQSLRAFLEHETQSNSSDGVISRSNCLLNCSKVSASKVGKSGHNVTLNWPHKGNLTVLTESNGAFLTLDVVFYVSFVLLVICKIFYATAHSLSDAVAYTILGNDRLKFGEQRLWGSVGTVVAVVSVTSFNGGLEDINQTTLFCTCLLFTSCACLVGILKLKCDSVPKNNAFFQDIGSVLRSGAVRFFFCKLLVFGLLCGSAQNFFLWFIIDIGGNHVHIGLTLLAYCFSSVLILRFTRRLLTWVGQQRAMQLVLFGYILRFLAFSFLQSVDPPWFLLIELLHGVTYSMFWAAASSTASLVAPLGTQATCQGVAGAIYWDLGRGLGTLLTGQLIGMTGARATFRYLSGLSAASIPVCCLFDHIWSLNKTQKKDITHRIADVTDKPSQDSATARMLEMNIDQTLTQSRIAHPEANGDTKLEICNEEARQSSCACPKDHKSKKVKYSGKADKNSPLSCPEDSPLDVTIALLRNDNQNLVSIDKS